MGPYIFLTLKIKEAIQKTKPNIEEMDKNNYTKMSRRLIISTIKTFKRN